MAGPIKIDQVRIVLIDPVTRDHVTYALADLDAAQKFIQKRLKERDGKSGK